MTRGIEIGLPSDPAISHLPAEATAVTDIDRDGRPDLVLENGRIWFPDAQSTTASPLSPSDPLFFLDVWNSYPTTLENAQRHVVYDFDGDGRNELVTADYNGAFPNDVATLRLWENDANNDWQEVWSYSDGPRIFNGMRAADVDDDGVIELVVGKIGGAYGGDPFVGPRVYIFESDGDDSLALDHLIEVDPTPGPFTLLDDLAVGDATGDGALDIAVGLADNETAYTQTWGSRVRVYTFNDDSGTFDLLHNHEQTNYGIGYLTAIDIGDSDNDGAGEVVFFERIIVDVHRLEYEDGSFSYKKTKSGVPAGVCMDVMVADLDTDGEYELLTGAQSGGNGHVHIFESTADDAYGLAYTDSAGIENTVLYVDVDEASDPPYIAGAAFSNQSIVLRYDEGVSDYETLAVIPLSAPGQMHEVTIGRLDADCGLDLMLSLFMGSNVSGIYQQFEADPVLGDVNCDDVVDINDLFAVINAWGPCGDPDDCPADLTDDGVVDINDLFVVLNNWA
jgi:hypothetical protein